MAEAKIPKNILDFSEDLHIDFDESDGKRTATMLGYSGKPMNHPFIGDLVVDVSGISFNNKVIPILEEHEEERKIGYSKKPKTENNQVYFDDITLLTNSFANEFYQNSKDGFPYQASISFYPKKIERVEEGAKSEVNGYTQKGPALIFRESVFRESSVCTFGMDHRTSSVAQSDQNIAIEMTQESADIIQELFENQQNHIEGESDMTQQTTNEANASQKQNDTSALETQLKEAQDQIKSYSDQLSQMQKHSTKQELATKLSSEDADFLMKFYDKLEQSEMNELADKIKSFTDKINELGASQGSSDQTPSNSEPSVEEVKVYADQNNLSFMEANKALYEQRVK